MENGARGWEEPHGFWAPLGSLGGRSGRETGREEQEAGVSQAWGTTDGGQQGLAVVFIIMWVETIPERISSSCLSLLFQCLVRAKEFLSSEFGNQPRHGAKQINETEPQLLPQCLSSM